jgi:polar amino acid transport system permease protein
MKEDAVRSRPGLIPWTRRLEQVPWWMLILLLLGVLIVYLFSSSVRYQDALGFLIPGVRLTIVLAVTAFGLSLFLGLLAGLGRVSKSLVFYTIATLYVQIVRGIPLLVQILYVAFVVTPGIVGLINLIGQGLWNLGVLSQLGANLMAFNIQSVDMPIRGIIALAFGYGAYEAEIFRAGIEAISKGQMEAARSLGMNYFQSMRYVVLPQAVRIVLPPLGNDFISMVKDTSLVSALAIRELTQLGKLYRGRTFRTFETWNSVAFLYLIMTISLSLLVRLMEKKLSTD